MTQKQIVIRLDSETLKLIKHAAVDKLISVNALMIEAAKEYISKN